MYSNKYYWLNIMGKKIIWGQCNFYKIILSLLSLQSNLIECFDKFHCLLIELEIEVLTASFEENVGLRYASTRSVEDLSLLKIINSIIDLSCMLPNSFLLFPEACWIVVRNVRIMFAHRPHDNMGNFILFIMG